MTIKDKAIKQLRKEGAFNHIKIFEVGIIIKARIKKLQEEKS